jgi:hypothetical protein
MTAAEFRALFTRSARVGPVGSSGARGALNHITPERIVAATRRVRSGIMVTLSRPLRAEAGVDCPERITA